jgi:beta-lactamase superfamily II metal-dependent hydrolase
LTLVDFRPVLLTPARILFRLFSGGEVIKSRYLVSSHLHPDHATGLAAVARNFKIEEYLFTENYKASALHQEIAQALGKRS